MLLRSCTTAIGIYSDSLPNEFGEHLKDHCCVVIKCHRPDQNLLTVAELVGAPFMLTVRDPRDCLVSWEAAFQVARPDILSQLRESASVLVKLSDHPGKLVVRYEDAKDQRQVLLALASRLGVSAPPELIEHIQEELSLERVRDRIASWEAEGRLDPNRAAEVWIEEAHWHANHCGDAATGKYRNNLSPREATVVSNSLRSFFDIFDYAPSPLPVLQSGDLLQFGSDGLAYAVEGFSFLESWGTWTNAPTARLRFPLASRAKRIQLQIEMTRAPCFNASTGAEASILVDGRKAGDLFARAGTPAELVLIYNGEAAGDCVEIEFQFKNLASPQSLGINSDDRLLGLGIRTLRLDYQ